MSSYFIRRFSIDVLISEESELRYICLFHFISSILTEMLLMRGGRNLLKTPFPTALVVEF